MTENPLDARQKRGARTWLALWMLSVLALWTGAHALNRWVLGMDDSSEARRLAFWTIAKVIAWLAPTFVLVRHFQGDSAPAPWLGLTTAKGVGIAALWSLLWISLQEAGVRFQVPLFSRPPVELTWSLTIGALLVAPCFEELLFRGAMLRVLRGEGYAGGTCVTLAALAFALLHVPGWIFRLGLIPSLVGAFVAMWAFGMVAGALAWRAPSLWAPILLHFANNFWSTSELAWTIDRVSGR